jgi:hypothetical protein
VNVDKPVSFQRNNVRHAITGDDVRFVLASGMGGSVLAIIITYFVFFPG